MYWFFGTFSLARNVLELMFSGFATMEAFVVLFITYSNYFNM